MLFRSYGWSFKGEWVFAVACPDRRDFDAWTAEQRALGRQPREMGAHDRFAVALRRRWKAQHGPDAPPLGQHVVATRERWPRDGG